LLFYSQLNTHALQAGAPFLGQLRDQPEQLALKVLKVKKVSQGIRTAMS
jgi:hypothetical protein